jgi:hypothetical protein
MFGLRIIPSSSTRWELSWLKTVRNTSSVTSQHCSRSLTGLQTHLIFGTFVLRVRLSRHGHPLCFD